MGWIERRETGAGPVWRWAARIRGQRVSETFASAAAAHLFDEQCQVAGYPPPGWIPGRGYVEADRIGEPLLAAVEAHIEGNARLSPSTRSEYGRLITRYLEGNPLAVTPIGQITADQVRAWIRDLQARGLAAKTIRNAHSLVSETLQRAVASGTLPTNPALGLAPPRETTTAVRALTHAEGKALVEAIPERHQLLVRTLLSTGVRWGEVTALQWRDLQGQAVSVTRAWAETEVRGQYRLAGPKTSAGRRVIPIPAELTEDLATARAGARGDTWIFPTLGGKPLRHGNFHYRVWRPTVTALAAAGTLSFEPGIHDLRHTYASWLLASGQVSILTLSRLLGHADPAVTLRVYSHLVGGEVEAVRAAVTAIDI